MDSAAGAMPSEERMDLPQVDPGFGRPTGLRLPNESARLVYLEMLANLEIGYCLSLRI